MALTTYTYALTAFPNDTVALDRLQAEIQASAITIALDHLEADTSECRVLFKAALPAGDETALDGLVAAHSGQPLPDTAMPVSLLGIATTDAGKLQVSPAPAMGTRYTKFSHNWADKTTWYTDAARVVDEVAVDGGAHTTYSLAHTHLIDSYHGKLSGEDGLVDGDGYSYRVVVKVNGATKTEQDPHYGSGGDYTIDYAAGEVTFLQALQPADVVAVTYHYARTAKFIITAPAGRHLHLVRVEVQFTKDVVVNDTVRFTAYATIGGQPVPVAATVYKTMFDFVNDADGALPLTHRAGGTGWRGLPDDVITLPWNYLAAIDIDSTLGMYVEVTMDHDEPFGGSFASATFYCIEEPNP